MKKDTDQVDKISFEDFSIESIINALGNPPDLTYHEFANHPHIQGHCLFIETLVDKNKIEDIILRFISEGIAAADQEMDTIAYLKYKIPIASSTSIVDLSACLEGLLDGKCLLNIHGSAEILQLDVAMSYHRAIDKPETEATVRGPHEAYNEDLATSIGLLRKRIRSTDLRFEQLIIGTKTETRVVIVYLEELAPIDIVHEFRSRIKSIETDSILDTSYIEDLIADKTFIPIPLMMKSERPDVTASHLLEGRIIVLVDGSPLALIGPVTFFQFFSSPEDYYQRTDIATFMLWIRFISFLLAIFVPALYIAVTTFQQGLLPPSLLVSIAAQREGVPFPSFVEAFLMAGIFEILREAGLRMPRIAGQAISIVGALVLGEAAVQAGLVSAAMVIVVAVTAIAGFVAPNYNFGLSQRFLQYSYMVLASFLGLFGILCGALFTIVHFASLKSFGIPFLAPIAPTIISDWKDVLMRVPRSKLKTYPRMNRTRRKNRF
ncbi:spore germination protein [Bacillus sp. FJAT-26390]|uniref:spore germination protein n=1 Tax=Bacillus sp. FJAT-26390 TaxID=1743142 RepID=UPI00080800E3|nr:spore germination protein [Bacillus sp. FJAT-26390]OBZ17087.1 spore gernimation protein [Bacillus sp. FJAT-26390]